MIARIQHLRNTPPFKALRTGTKQAGLPDYVLKSKDKNWEGFHVAEASSSIPSIGKKAPAFTAQTNTGKALKLSDLKGKPVVLYFYPKDDTPGCTVEAKGFQANLSKFEKAGAIVLGVSPDGVASHCKFAEKFGLSFTLLADEKHELCNAYGVWVEKSMYGKKYWGVQRATFLIDKNGVIANVWPKVKPEGHAEEVLESIKQLK